MAVSRRERIVLFCGALACAAAVVKLTAPMPDWFACWVPTSYEAWGALLLVEFAVGAVMFTWPRSVTAWSLGVVGLATVGGVAAVLAWQNHAKCGCYGPIDWKPSFMAVGDGVLLAALLLARPSNLRMTLGRIAASAVLLAVTVVTIGGAAEGVRRWKVARQGYEIPPIIRLGDIEASGQTVFQIRIVNRSASPMEFRTLEGTYVQSSVEVPFTVPANTTRSIDAIIYTGSGTGRFCGTVFYRFDHRGQLRQATTRLSGNIRASSP